MITSAAVTERGNYNLILKVEPREAFNEPTTELTTNNRQDGLPLQEIKLEECSSEVLSASVLVKCLVRVF
jgi:hypothetical protein